MTKGELIAEARRRAARHVRRGALADVEAAIARAVFTDGTGTIHVRTASGDLRTGSTEELLAIVHATTVSGLPERTRRGGEDVTNEEITVKLASDRSIHGF